LNTRRKEGGGGGLIAYPRKGVCPKSVENYVYNHGNQKGGEREKKRKEKCDHLSLTRGATERVSMRPLDFLWIERKGKEGKKGKKEAVALLTTRPILKKNEDGVFWRLRHGRKRKKASQNRE